MFVMNFLFSDFRCLELNFKRNRDKEWAFLHYGLPNRPKCWIKNFDDELRINMVSKICPRRRKFASNVVKSNILTVGANTSISGLLELLCPKLFVPIHVHYELPLPGMALFCIRDSQIDRSVGSNISTTNFAFCGVENRKSVEG